MLDPSLSQSMVQGSHHLIWVVHGPGKPSSHLGCPWVQGSHHLIWDCPWVQGSHHLTSPSFHLAIISRGLTSFTWSCPQTKELPPRHHLTGLNKFYLVLSPDQEAATSPSSHLAIISRSCEQLKYLAPESAFIAGHCTLDCTCTLLYNDN